MHLRSLNLERAQILADTWLTHARIPTPQEVWTRHIPQSRFCRVQSTGQG